MHSAAVRFEDSLPEDHKKRVARIVTPWSEHPAQGQIVDVPDHVERPWLAIALDSAEAVLFLALVPSRPEVITVGPTASTIASVAMLALLASPGEELEPLVDRIEASPKLATAVDRARSEVAAGRRLADSQLWVESVSEVVTDVLSSSSGFGFLADGASQTLEIDDGPGTNLIIRNHTGTYWQGVNREIPSGSVVGSALVGPAEAVPVTLFGGGAKETAIAGVDGRNEIRAESGAAVGEALAFQAVSDALWGLFGLSGSVIENKDRAVRRLWASSRCVNNIDLALAFTNAVEPAQALRGYLVALAGCSSELVDILVDIGAGKLRVQWAKSIVGFALPVLRSVIHSREIVNRFLFWTETWRYYHAQPFVQSVCQEDGVVGECPGPDLSGEWKGSISWVGGFWQAPQIFWTWTLGPGGGSVQIDETMSNGMPFAGPRHCSVSMTLSPIGDTDTWFGPAEINCGGEFPFGGEGNVSWTGGAKDLIHYTTFREGASAGWHGSVARVTDPT